MLFPPGQLIVWSIPRGYFAFCHLDGMRAIGTCVTPPVIPRPD